MSVNPNYGKAPYWNSGAGMYEAREVTEKFPPTDPGWFGWRALYKGSWQAIIKTGEWTKGRWYTAVAYPGDRVPQRVRVSEVRCEATCGGIRGKFVKVHIEEVRVTDPVSGKTHWEVRA